MTFGGEIKTMEITPFPCTVDCKKIKSTEFSYFCRNVLGIHDLSGTQLAMIFSFHVGLTDSVMQRMQFFFLSVSVRHFLATILPDLLF
jgi:hypothetical protein